MNIERLELKTGARLNLLAEFYGGSLGLPVVATDPDELTVCAGASELAFRHEPGFTGVYHFAFNVRENRVQSTWEYLEKRRVERIADPAGNTVFDFASWNAHAMYFHDPSGNIVEFIARHELPAPSSDGGAPFNPADELLSVSEIGLPTPDTAALAAQLRDTVRITTYRPSMGDLIPVGDANGLFIVVPEGRVWFPTSDIAAQLLPVAATVTNEQGERFQVDARRKSSSGELSYAVSRVD